MEELVHGIDICSADAVAATCPGEHLRRRQELSCMAQGGSLANAAEEGEAFLVDPDPLDLGMREISVCSSAYYSSRMPEPL